MLFKSENTFGIPNFVYIFGILLIIYYFSVDKNESFQAVVVENAYSDTRCIDDKLPLIRFYPRENPNTFRCLSVDGEKCIDRNTVGVPSDYQCNDSKKNVNFYLTTDGIRNVRVNPNLPISKVFNDFENLKSNPENANKNIKYMTCTPDGLKDGDHWCGKTWNTINDQCDKPKGKFGEYQSICKNLPDYLKSQDVGHPTIDESYATIAQNQKQAILATQQKRSANIRGR